MNIELLKRQSVLVEECNELLTQTNLSQKTRVVAYGLMNAGKSYLLNILSDNIENEFFRTDDIRATSVINKLERDGVIYIDTPGLDASDEDDEEAERGAVEADLMLFTHQPQGELEALELEFLGKLIKSFGEYAKSHVVLVLTKSDKAAEDDVETIKKSILAQCKKKFGIELVCFVVSSQRYKNGVLKNSNKLCDLSGVNELKTYIQASSLASQEVRAQRKKAELNEVLTRLDELQTELDSEIKHLKMNVNDELTVFSSSVKKLKTSMQDSTKKFADLT